jgi:hypothetical protein
MDSRNIEEDWIFVPYPTDISAESSSNNAETHPTQLHAFDGLTFIRPVYQLPQPFTARNPRAPGALSLEEQVAILIPILTKLIGKAKQLRPMLPDYKSPSAPLSMKAEQEIKNDKKLKRKRLAAKLEKVKKDRLLFE